MQEDSTGRRSCSWCRDANAFPKAHFAHVARVHVDLLPMLGCLETTNLELVNRKRMVSEDIGITSLQIDVHYMCSVPSKASDRRSLSYQNGVLVAHVCAEYKAR